MLPEPLRAIRPEWRILDAVGDTVRSDRLPERSAPRGKNLRLGTIAADLTGLQAPATYTLQLELRGTPFRNAWQFWLYPADTAAPGPEGVLVTAAWAEAEQALAQAGRVLFHSGRPEAEVPDLKLSTMPIFWNRLMNPSRAWMLGLLCDADHAALAGFPTEAHCDWQWVDLLADTTAMNIEALPADMRPVVLPIDDWNRNLRLAMLFECAVGPGRLMVTSLNLSDSGVGERTGAAALRRSLLAYMASPRFAPEMQLSPAELAAWLPGRYVAPATVLTPPSATPDIVDPGEVRRRAEGA